jgi:hypothetical protein
MRASLGESGSCDAAVPAASVTIKPAKTDFMATLLNQIPLVSLLWSTQRANAAAEKADPAAALSQGYISFASRRKGLAQIRSADWLLTRLLIGVDRK